MLASVNCLTPSFVASVQLLLTCHGPQLLADALTPTPRRYKPQSLKPALISPAMVTPKLDRDALKPLAHLVHAALGQVAPALAGLVPEEMVASAGLAKAVYYGCD